VRTRKGQGERLSELELGLFDIVYSCNALDHAYDPLMAIRQMVAACKPVGAVVFEGNTNEAVRQRNQGLNQWNFMPVENGDMMVWQMDKTAVSLRHALGNEVLVQARGDRWYRVEITHHGC
jgi:hypothetical protein